MRAEVPHVARLRDRFCGRVGHVVRVGQRFGWRGGEEPQQLLLGERGRGQVEPGGLQGREFEGQLAVVPCGEGGGPVVGDAVRPGLLGGQAAGDVHRDGRHPELPGRLEPGVADDDHVLLVHDDRLLPAELLQGGGDGVYPGVVVAGVVLVRPDRVDRAVFDQHGIPPRASRRAAGKQTLSGSPTVPGGGCRRSPPDGTIRSRARKSPIGELPRPRAKCPRFLSPVVVAGVVRVRIDRVDRAVFHPHVAPSGAGTRPATGGLRGTRRSVGQTLARRRPLPAVGRCVSPTSGNINPKLVTTLRRGCRTLPDVHPYLPVRTRPRTHTHACEAAYRERPATSGGRDSTSCGGGP